MITKMKVGTKSVLFGVHAFWFHPFMVALAWIKLFGWPLDIRIWIAFFVHDLGYWGKAFMDDEDGQNHVELGGRIMRIFGREWQDFTRLHSRFYAKKHNVPFSRLCVADKYAICIESPWFYILRASLSGEIIEYMKNWGSDSKTQWFSDIQKYMDKWTYSIEGVQKRFKQ